MTLFSRLSVCETILQQYVWVLRSILGALMENHNVASLFARSQIQNSQQILFDVIRCEPGAGCYMRLAEHQYPADIAGSVLGNEVYLITPEEQKNT